MPVAKLIFLAVLLTASTGFGQQEQEPDPSTEEQQITPKQVGVKVVAEDQKISGRLTRIMEATGWFEQVKVEVREGIVFLRGFADSQKHLEWAGQLAGKTEDVVAVVNQLKLKPVAFLDFTPAWTEIGKIAAEFIRNIPLILFAILLLIFTWFAAKVAMYGLTFFLKRRLKSAVLRSIAAKALAVLIFLFGLYLILRISGLTRLALTVLGSTGLLGLVIGFAFRDIAENFLASILLSIQNPFVKKDLIQVAGTEGYVQSINTRSTLLMTRDGNYVQIPNAIIYKETITNLTANPNTRFEFSVGIGYEDSIAHAQSIALQVLQEHPAILDDPEPMVLVDELGSATVVLKVFFWINMTTHSHLKVRSAVIRLVKIAFEKAGISMPDEAREIIFPKGVNVQMVEQTTPKEKKKKVSQEEPSHAAEDELSSDSDEIQEQASHSRNPEGNVDLLEKS